MANLLHTTCCCFAASLRCFWSFGDFLVQLVVQRVVVRWYIYSYWNRVNGVRNRCGPVHSRRRWRHVDSREPNGWQNWQCKLSTHLLGLLLLSFFLFYQNDNEATIRRLHLTLSCTMAIASSNCVFLVSMSCFIFSIHFFGCLPWFLHPVMKQCITFTGSRSLPILYTCSNHVSLRCAILSTNVLSWCRVLRTVSFFIRSRLVTRNNLLSHVIDSSFVFLSQTPAFWAVQHNRDLLHDKSAGNLIKDRIRNRRSKIRQDSFCSSHNTEPFAAFVSVSRRCNGIRLMYPRTLYWSHILLSKSLFPTVVMQGNWMTLEIKR